MRYFTFLLYIFLIASSNAFCQTEYATPPIQRQNIFSVELKDIVGDKEEFKFAFIIENKSNDKYLVFELSKIAISFTESDVYYPKNDEIIVVNPNSKERRTVRVVGKGNYQTDMIEIEFPRMQVNGKQTDFVSSESFNTNESQNLSIGAYATAELSGFSVKKDNWSGELQVKTNTFEGMMLMDLNKIEGTNANSAKLPVEFKRDKLSKVALVSNDKFKSKFSIADLGSTLSSLQIGNAISMYELLELDVPNISIKKVGYVEPPKVENKEVNLCDSYSKLNGLPVKVVIFNATGVCFKMAANGKKINDDLCSNVEYDSEYGTNVLTIALSNGQSLTSKIYPAEGDIYLVFEIIEKKGEWKLRRKFDLSGDARKVDNSSVETTKTTLCKDEFVLVQGMDIIRNLTIVKITSDKVFYVDCGSNAQKSISKMDILAIQYSNGYYDKFDFNGNAPKANMSLVRTEKEVIELRNSDKKSSSIIIGPNR